MVKKLIAAFGILFSVLCLFAYSTLQKNESHALALDKKESRFAEIGSGSILPCSWSVIVPERVLTLNKSEAIVVSVKNQMKEKCESTISFRAPGFDISPFKEEQTISLTSKGNGSISWIISPHISGTYTIAVSDSTNSKTFGITVTNMFGLTAIQAQLASVAGTLFGPMFTIPWWWEKLYTRRQKRPIKKEESL